MKFITLCCLLFSINFYGQIRLSNNAQLSLLTCGSGNELYSLFGHTGLRVYDPELNINIVYNFGMFDFSTPNFYLKFIKGDLMYFGAIESCEDFLFQYQYFERSVVEQTLNLDENQKNTIFENLNLLLSTDQKYYQYQFIETNCTTKINDILNEVLPTPLNKVGQEFPSYRTVINGYLTNHFFEKLGINLIFGSKTDIAATQIFLPIELENSLDESPFLGQKMALLSYENQVKMVWWNSLYLFLLLVFIFTFVKPNILNNLWFVMQGLLGLFFLLVGFYSFHQEVLNNYNVLVTSPLLLVYAIMRIKKISFKRLIALAYLLSVLIFMLMHHQKDHFFLMLIFVASNLIIILRHENYFGLLKSQSLPFVKQNR